MDWAVNGLDRTEHSAHSVCHRAAKTEDFFTRMTLRSVFAIVLPQPLTSLSFKSFDDSVGLPSTTGIGDAGRDQAA